MRLLLAVTLVFALAAFGPVGCGKPKSPSPTKSKDDTKPATKPKTTPPAGEEDPPEDKASVKIKEVKEVKIKQGDKASVKLELVRTKYTGKVDLKATVDDKYKKDDKVTAKVKDGGFAKEKNEATVDIMVAEDAPVGKAEITVTGTGDEDVEAEAKITVNIEKKAAGGS